MAQAKSALASSSKRTRTLAGQVVPPADVARMQALATYESALQLLHAGKYDKAHAAFNLMLENAPPELRDRIRMYISTCLSQISKGKTTFSTHEERFDYAISLLNHGHYDDAREHFEEISRNPKADYAFYGLAVLASMTGDSDSCLAHLARAIDENPRNRIQARADSDFQDMADDPRFTELLYPDA